MHHTARDDERGVLTNERDLDSVQTARFGSVSSRTPSSGECDQEKQDTEEETPVPDIPSIAIANDAREL